MNECRPPANAMATLPSLLPLPEAVHRVMRSGKTKQGAFVVEDLIKRLIQIRGTT